MKKLVSIFMSLLLTFSFSANVFAAEQPKVDTRNNAVALASSTDYGNVWLNSAAGGSFTVYSAKTGRVGVTLKIEGSKDSFANLNIKNSNGSTSNIYLDASSSSTAQKKYTISNATAGTYTINYNAYTDSGMRIMCWIYK